VVCPCGYQPRLGLTLLCARFALLCARDFQRGPGEEQSTGGPDATDPGSEVAYLNR